MQCSWVQFSGGLTVSMTLVGRQRCELCACHEWRTSLRPIPSLQPNQPIITHNSVLAAEHVYKAWDAQCHSSMPCGHTPDTEGAHLCTNVVMNRRCARGAASRVWVTIRVQAGGWWMCAWNGAQLLCTAIQRVPEEAPDLSAWRQNQKEESGEQE